MPLSDREQRLLEEMERQLYGNSGAPRTEPFEMAASLNYRRVVFGIVGALVGVGLVFVGIATAMTWLGVVGFVLVVAALALGFSGRTEPRAAPAGSGPSGSTDGNSSNSARGAKPVRGAKPAGQGFMDRMNDRWDRRQFPQ